MAIYALHERTFEHEGSAFGSVSVSCVPASTCLSACLRPAEDRGTGHHAPHGVRDEPQDDNGLPSAWNDNKGAPHRRGDIMRGTDLSVPKCPAKVSPFGMALGTLAEIAVRLVIGGYIFAVVVYVNASDNWDKDDDIGTRIRGRLRRARQRPNTIAINRSPAS